MTPLRLTADRAGERCDQFLARMLPQLTRSAAQRLLEEGAVTRAGEAVRKNAKTAPGDVFTVILPDPDPVDAVPQDIPLDVVYEDADVIVVNKPVGMVVHRRRATRTGHWSTPCCITAAAPSPESTGPCARASSTALTGTPRVS